MDLLSPNSAPTSKPSSASRALQVTSPETGVTQLTLDRPDRLNALDSELIDDLHAALGNVARDEDCRVLILTGAGRGFCSGLDLKDFDADNHATRGRPQAMLALQERITALVARMVRLPQPIITAVNGAASGGGLALVLASDIRLANPAATFNTSFIKIGLSSCDIGTSWFLPRLVGLGRAQEMMLTGRLVGAVEAARIGLIQDVVAPELLLRRCIEKGREIATNAPFGVRLTKQTLWASLEIPGLAAAMELENRTQVMASFTEDHAEAIGAFMDRRTPQFYNH